MKPILRLLIVAALAGAGIDVAHGQLRKVVDKVVGKVAADQLEQAMHEKTKIEQLSSIADDAASTAYLDAMEPPPNSALIQAVRRFRADSIKIAAEKGTKMDELLPSPPETIVPLFPWRNASALWFNQD